MQKIAIYGKGGIGKSTLAANVSVAYAQRGKRVLHIGCDPKHDSTLLLTEGVPIKPVAEMIIRNPGMNFTLDNIMTPGVLNIGCIESGGPEPGVGCGGWLISRMIDMLQESQETVDEYDLLLFDVLGDVVCGGFANPLRQGYADRVIIVLSEELLSIFAANNIAKMVARYANQGIRLLGLVVNQRDNMASLYHVDKFAEKLSTRVLAVLPRDPLVMEAERQGKTVLMHNSEAPFAQKLLSLTNELAQVNNLEGKVPTPMADNELLAFLREPMQ